jgi:predicted HAD superfamily phosphohydrolase YqeG
MIPTMVIMTDIYNSSDNTFYTFYVRSLICQQKLAKANHRWIAKGLTVTFRTVEDAAKFRLRYDSDTM